MDLDARKKTILKAIIQTYLETGEAGRFPDHIQVHGSESELRYHPE